MTPIRHRAPITLAALLVSGVVVAAQTPAAPTPAQSPLSGTSWQLVRFESSTEVKDSPGDRNKYTLSFSPDGTAFVRSDCTRGTSTWKSPGQGQLHVGPLNHSRGICSWGGGHDRIIRDWLLIRSFLIENGHLFITLTGDVGVYEFEPA